MPPVHAALPSLAPLLPELILGIGVMVLILTVRGGANAPPRP